MTFQTFDTINGISYERNPTTSDGKQQKVDAIAKNYSPELLRRENAKTLRALATGIITNTRAKKEELAEALISATSLRRKDLEIEATNVQLAKVETLNLKKLELAREGIPPEALEQLVGVFPGDAPGAATQLFKALMFSYAASTVVKTHQNRILEWVRTHGTLTEDYKKAFCDTFLSCSLETTREVNRQGREKVMAHRMDRPQVPIEPVLELAQDILNRLDAQDSKLSWKEVFFAVAVATGRRMAEILGDHSTFTKASDSTLLFKGQLKQRGEDDRGEFEIDCLLPVDQVLRALASLEQKKIPNENDGVNRKYSKALSSELSSKFKSQLKTSSNGFISSAKDCRAFYAAERIHSYGRRKHKPIAEDLYLSMIMGHAHEKGSQAYQNYQQVAAYSVNDEEEA